MKSILKVCKGCGERFKVFPSHIHRYRYCCRGCKNESTNGHIKIHKYGDRYRCEEIKIGHKEWKKLHRFVMERHLGRKLTSDEIIHHIDGNPLNNSFDNLLLTTRREHRKLHQKIREWKCNWCSNTFFRNGRHGKRIHKFCSLSCASKYGNSLRNHQ